jgi:hypothetical protein
MGNMTTAEAIQLLRGALADIALSDDMTLAMARKKAQRIYDATAWMDDADGTGGNPPKALCVCGRELTPRDGFGLQQVAGEAMTYSVRHAGVAGECAIPAPMVRDVMRALVRVEGGVILG